MIGRGCATIVRYSVTPPTDSRSIVSRGFGHRPAVKTSTRAMSVAARIARTRGLVVDNRASASASVNINDWAATPDGAESSRERAAEHGFTHNTSSSKGNGRRAGPSGQDRKEAGGAREGRELQYGGSCP